MCQFISKVLQNGNAESSESASTSSIGSNNSSHNKAPGAQLHQHKNMNNTTISNSINSNGINSLQSTINNNSNSLLNPYGEYSTDVTKQVCLNLKLVGLLIDLFLIDLFFFFFFFV